MNIDPRLLEYIQTHLNAGHSSETIRQALLKAGWQERTVDEAFESLQKPDKGNAGQQELPAPNSTPAESSEEKIPQRVESLVDTPKKYPVLRSVQDTLVAIKFNFSSFIGATVSSYLLASAALGLAFILVSVVAGMFNNPSLGLTVAVSILVPVAFLMVWYVFAFAFIVAAMSLTLLDGIEGKKSPFVATLMKALQRTPRAIGANILLALISAAPLFLILVISILVGLTDLGATGRATLFVITFVAGVVGNGWLIIALLRYGLAPQIAVLEPTLPLKSTLSRSSHLLTGGGKWFLFKGFMLTLAAFTAIGILTGNSLQDLQSTENGLVIVLMLMVSVLVEGALVMLYHNRATVKDAQSNT